MNYTINHRYTGAVLFECEIPEGLESGLHMRHALEKAISARADLARAYLARANLAGANLAGAYLARANLAGANLAGAYLDGANLAGAYLAEANLARANLAGAYLAGAYLAGANLAGANLAGAYLAGANLARAKWADKITITQRPIQLYGLQWSVTVLDAHMQIGCQLHSLKEWLEFDDVAIAAMDGRDALRFWRAYKDVLLGLARANERSFEAQEA